MPSSVIGALRVSLGLDSAQFSTGASSAEKRAEQMGLRIGTSLRKAASEANEFGKAFTGLALVAGGAALGALAARGLEYASSLAEVAQQLGVTTKDLQTYRYPVRLILRGGATFTASVGTSVDGCTTVNTLTAGGSPITYSTSTNEYIDVPVTTDLAVVYCLVIAATSGTETYAVRQ